MPSKPGEAKPAKEKVEVKPQEMDPDLQAESTKTTPEPTPESNPELTQRQQQDKHQADRRSTEQKSTYQKKSSDQEPAQVPKQFGHKINVNVQVAKAVASQLAEQFDAPAFISKETFKQILEERPKLAKQILEKPTQEARQRFIKDSMFKFHPQAARIQQKMAEQAQRQQQAEQGQVMQDMAEDVLKKGDLVQLFRLRHKSEDKDNFRNIMRNELAKAKARALQEKVQGIKQQAEGGGGGAQARGVNRTTQIADPAKSALAQKLANASSASAFEALLQKALAGSKLVPGLPDGIKAKFLLKGSAEWQAFFKNVFQLQGAEVQSQAQLEQLAYALYRGIYTKAESGKSTLVADLVFDEAGEHKFAQIALDDELAEIFKKLNPGEEISKELLKKLGEELTYLKLAHVVNQAQLSEEQKTAILKEFQKQFSTGSRDKLENALIAMRQSKREEEKDPPPFVYAGNQFDKKEERHGPPKLFMALLYTVFGVTAAVLVFILARYLT